MATELEIARKWARRWKRLAMSYLDKMDPHRTYRRESRELSRRIEHARRNEDGSLSGLPAAVRGALLRAGYGNLEQVARLSDKEILHVRNIGVTGLAHIRAALARQRGEDVLPVPKKAAAAPRVHLARRFTSRRYAPGWEEPLAACGASGSMVQTTEVLADATCRVCLEKYPLWQAELGRRPVQEARR